MISMTRIKLNNSNGYSSLKGYPFPVVVKVANDRMTEYSIKNNSGLIAVSCSELIKAAQEWDSPSWFASDETFMFSRGDHFDNEERNGWSQIDDNPFAHWNELKASRPVGAL